MAQQEDSAAPVAVRPPSKHRRPDKLERRVGRAGKAVDERVAAPIRHQKDEERQDQAEADGADEIDDQQRQKRRSQAVRPELNQARYRTPYLAPAAFRACISAPTSPAGTSSAASSSNSPSIPAGVKKNSIRAVAALSFRKRCRAPFGTFRYVPFPRGHRMRPRSDRPSRVSRSSGPTASGPTADGGRRLWP